MDTNEIDMLKQCDLAFRILGAKIIDMQQDDAGHVRFVLDNGCSIEIDAVGGLFPKAAKLVIETRDGGG